MESNHHDGYLKHAYDDEPISKLTQELVIKFSVCLNEDDANEDSNHSLLVYDHLHCVEILNG